MAYITVTTGGTLTDALSTPWANSGYTTIFNGITLVTGQNLTRPCVSLLVAS